ncbi:MAG: 50S ribosomal protein L10 [Coriobacteriales bacterium]|nr:50S ribosomal protein L10 [Actinomycetes bacterium]
MPLADKREIVSEIKDHFHGASAVIMTDYRGLTVKQMQALRSKLRESGAEVKVYKNTLTELALRELALPSMDSMLAGPTAFVFATGDPVGPAKAIMDFAKTNKSLEVKGGFVDHVVVGADDIKALAALPSRDVLIAQIMGAMLSPVRGFMSMCNAPAGALARVMKAVADQKAAA